MFQQFYNVHRNTHSVEAGGFINLALGQKFAWAVPGDFSGSERDNITHCWESGKTYVTSNASTGTKPCKPELLS